MLMYYYIYTPDILNYFCISTVYRVGKVSDQLQITWLYFIERSQVRFRCSSDGVLQDVADSSCSQHLLDRSVNVRTCSDPLEPAAMAVVELLLGQRTRASWRSDVVRGTRSTLSASPLFSFQELWSLLDRLKNVHWHSTRLAHSKTEFCLLASRLKSWPGVTPPPLGTDWLAPAST